MGCAKKTSASLRSMARNGQKDGKSCCRKAKSIILKWTIKNIKWTRAIQPRIIEIKASTTVYGCYNCGSIYDDNRSLQFHRRLAHGHGIYRPARYFATTGDCLACGAVLHTRPRLVHHLNHGTTDCLAWYSANQTSMVDEEVRKLDDIDRVARNCACA